MEASHPDNLDVFMGIQGSICFRKNFFRDIDNYFILKSALFFLFAYIFAIGWLENIIYKKK